LNIVKLPEYQQVRQYLPQLAAVASELHRLGWAPKNAGNFSIRLNHILLTKISGAQMRYIARNPCPYLCYVSLPNHGFQFQIIPPAAVPTGEILTHIAAQRTIARYRPQERVLLHTHPVEIIKFSRSYPDPVKLNSFLNQYTLSAKSRFTATAIRRFPSGSRSLALATARAFRKYQVIIWPGHGVIASGKTIPAAFVKIRKINSLFQQLLTNAR
jgi:ribulose-5-phosphate 4-epimerase/fuculose-1-phosphate aldolase